MAAKTYLDENGLLYLWGKIKSHVTSALTPYSTTTQVDGKIATGVSEAKTYTDTKAQNYYTKTETEQKLGEVEVDLSNYDTKTEVDTKIQNAITSNAVDLSGYYTKTEVDSKITSVYKYKGSVNTYADLPTTGVEVGWVYNVATADKTNKINAGDNLAWDGTKWDNLGGEIDLSDYLLATDVTPITNATIDTITAAE